LGRRAVAPGVDQPVLAAVRGEGGRGGGLADVLTGAFELEIPGCVRSGKNADVEHHFARRWPVLGAVASESVRRVDCSSVLRRWIFALGAHGDFFDVPGRLERN
jgi:hypothetical protein